ncbi:putative Transmembrane protein [Quillaja saponaria]|uniref:Transmembrane protein n=1 Tax=Quillaja saponaria TaxID=32244 RepID=A0AAD7QD78_QUISA|nr:putative Transmembrane protein [Quillaja saponaria]
MNMTNFTPILFLCLLATSFYFLSQYTSFASSSPSQTVVKRPPRKLSMLLPNHEYEYHKIKVAGEAMKSATNKEGSTTLEYARSIEKLDDLVYHTDYHGVTTHPNPTPRHPTP